MVRVTRDVVFALAVFAFACKAADSLEHKLTAAQSWQNKPYLTLKVSQKSFGTPSAALKVQGSRTLWRCGGMFSTYVTSVCLVRKKQEAAEHMAATLTPFLQTQRGCIVYIGGLLITF